MSSTRKPLHNWQYNGGSPPSLLYNGMFSQQSHEIGKSGKNKPGLTQEPNCSDRHSDSFIRTHNHSLGVISHQDSLRDSVRWGGKISQLHQVKVTFRLHFWKWTFVLRLLPAGFTGKRSESHVLKRTGVWSAPEFGWALTPAQTRWTV